MSYIKHSRASLLGGAVIPTVLAAACLGAPALASAEGAPQAAPAPVVGLEEIVVTAERRKSDVQATPIAITALSADALEKSHIDNLADLSGFAPGLVITKTSGRETVPTIRGIGSATPENYGSTGPGVSMFVDGVYIGDSLSPGEGFFDLDHVEVMRGPQGTLYGVSSTGGAIILVGKQPTLKSFEASGDVSVGDYNYHKERASINVPIGDDLALRVSGQKLDHDGFATNTLAPGYNLDDAHTQDLKASLLWKPTDDFSATLTAQWYRQRNHGEEQKWINDPNANPRVVTQDLLSKSNMDSQLYHLNLKKDFAWFSISSTTAYHSYTSDAADNVTFSSFDLYSPYEYVPTWKHNENTWSEELDVMSRETSKVKWIAGAFFMRRSGTDYTLEYSGTDPTQSMPSYVDPWTPVAQIPTNLVYGNATTDVRTVIEPFVEITYPILDNLRLTVGGRYNYESHEHSSHNFSAYGNDPIFSLTDKTYVPTWRAQLDYDVTKTSNIYVSAATGYKSGGVNGNANAALIPWTFKPEKNTAFELGSKNMFFDRSLRLNMAAFYYIYKNMQYIETDPIPFDQGMTNIPLIHIWGWEGEASYTGFDNHLHVNANLSLEEGEVRGNTYVLYPSIVNAVYAQPVCAGGGQYYSTACWTAVRAAAKNIKGNSPPAMPKVSGAVNVSYDFDVPHGVLTPRIEMIYRGSEWARIFNEPALDRIPAYDLWNLDVTYAPTNSNLRLSLAVTNLANKAAVNSRYTSPYEQGLTSEEFVPPRQIIGTIAYKF
jgi:iron complex outermembrane recepter protein